LVIAVSYCPNSTIVAEEDQRSPDMKPLTAYAAFAPLLLRRSALMSGELQAGKIVALRN
jgi:hypothetical protein